MRLLEDPTDLMRFIEVVEYDSDEAKTRGEQAVESDPEMQQYLKRWRELLAEPPVVEFWTEVTASVRE